MLTPTTRRRRRSGFTLVEMLMVIAMMTIVVSLAATAMKGQRGEKAPGFTRGLLAMVQQARQAALSTGLPARLRFIPATVSGSATRIVVEQKDPLNGWPALTVTSSAGLHVPQDVDLADLGIANGALTTSPPNTTMPTQEALCFLPNGNVTPVVPLQTDDCPTTGSGGATIFVRSFDDKIHLKVMVWGVTGLPRISDQW